MCFFIEGDDGLLTRIHRTGWIVGERCCGDVIL